MSHDFKRFYLLLITLLFYGSQLAAQTFESITPNHGGPGTLVTMTGTDLSNITFMEFGLIRCLQSQILMGQWYRLIADPRPLQFETPGCGAYDCNRFLKCNHPTGLQFVITGHWTVVVSNIGSVADDIDGNVATFPVIEGPSSSGCCNPSNRLVPPISLRRKLLPFTPVEERLMLLMMRIIL